MRNQRSVGRGIGASAVSVALASTLMLAGCGSQPAQTQEPAEDTDAAVEQEAEPEAEEPAAPEIPAVFSNSLYPSGVSWVKADGTPFESIDVDGTTIKLQETTDYKEAGLLGPFSEGRAIVAWRTSDIDQEWKEEVNARMHAAVIDTSGKVIKVLDDVLASYSDPDGSLLSMTRDAYYSEGIAFLNATSQEGIDLKTHLIALDTSGNVVFTINDDDKAMTDGGLAQSPHFYDGVAQISKDVFVDKTGKVVYDARTTSHKYVVPEGNGLVAETNGFGNSSALLVRGSQLWDYADNLVFDVDTLKGSTYTDAQATQLGAGIALVSLEEPSPNAGSDKTHWWTGLYDVKAKKWILEPVRKSLIAGPVRDGVFAVELSDSENSGGMGSDASTSPDAGGLKNGIGLMRVDGTWAVEPSDDGSFSGQDSDSYVSYLGSGQWQYMSDAENFCTIADVSGATAQTFDPSFKVSAPFGYWPEHFL